jgi:hypothetical protein
MTGQGGCLVTSAGPDLRPLPQLRHRHRLHGPSRGAPRGIQHLLGALDASNDILILHRTRHDEIYLAPKDGPEFLKEPKVGAYFGENYHLFRSYVTTPSERSDAGRCMIA